MSRVVHTNIWSAYGYAKQAGYTGTEEEFKIGLKEGAEAAEHAEASATAASTSASSASVSAFSASVDALKSEGFALGTQGGETVGTTSPYYHNNSKYYEEQAAAVAASIPQDYSTLSNEVTDLKNAFNSLVIKGNEENLFSKYNAVVGFLATTGNLSRADLNTRTTDFIPVGNETSLTIQTWMTLPSGITHWFAVCFYDSNKELVGSRQTKTGGSGSYDYFTVSIPANAVYFRATTRVYNSWKVMLQYGNVASAYEYNFDDIEFPNKEKAKHLAINFEMGNISISTSGWSYPNENTKTRIRTIINTSIHLLPGDIVSTDETGTVRFFLGWKNLDGTYSILNWSTQNYRVVNEGDYVVLATLNPEAEITNFNSVANSIWITRNNADYVQYKEDALANLIVSNRKFSVRNANVRSINHRGWYTAPENTLPAFAQSKHYGFDYVECDVRATSDDVFVLLHDETVDRTSNGTGNIASLTYSEVSALDFGSWKADKYAGTKIPTLEEFLLFCKWIGLHPYLEVKNTLSDSQIAEVVALVNDTGMRGKLTYIGDGYVIQKISLADNKARLGLTTGLSDILEANITVLESIRQNGNDIFMNAQIDYVTSTGIALLKNASIPLECWNGNISTVSTADAYISGFTIDNFVASDYFAQEEYKKYILL